MRFCHSSFSISLACPSRFLLGCNSLSLSSPYLACPPDSKESISSLEDRIDLDYNIIWILESRIS
jgi:hypothetical protein